MSFEWLKNEETKPDLPFVAPKRGKLLWLFPLFLILGLLTVLAAIAYHEMRTSKMQAEWLSWYGEHITFDPEPGPNPQMRYPITGPYNFRLGYTYLPYFLKALKAENFTVSEQMRASPTYNYFVDRGMFPIYHTKSTAGLTLNDRNDEKLYTASYPNHVFQSFDEIPSLLVNTLLFIENRELLKDGPVTRNPVIEWDRFFYAIFGQIANIFHPHAASGGGSTLATQIEKFRFSSNGQTTTGMDKLRQIASGSLRVYLDGPDTRKAREKIVLDYLNSTPLSARPGFGEVNSIGDGLWAWFGIDLKDFSDALNAPENDPDKLRLKGQMYRHALGLILAQRRPSAYLNPVHTDLDVLTESALDWLAAAKVISPELRLAARDASFKFLPQAPLPPQKPFIEQKAVNSLRNHLLSMLGLSKLYEVDRLDLTAKSSLDETAQKQTVAFLQKMGDPEFLKAIGLYGFRLLDPTSDPTKIKWSVVLYERTDDSNKLRLQADNIDAPFDMNEGMKLDLGSTAKLRTLVSYFEIMRELYRRYAGLSDNDLREMGKDAPDALTSWAIDWLKDHPKASLDEMLDAAAARKYSGNPGETFFTGGGAHRFVNFEHSEDYKNMDLHEAFRDSVNLVFVRVMRDIINYTIAQGEQTKEEILDDPDVPARKAYLERFADQEGTQYLNKYINAYANITPNEALEKLVSNGHKGASALAVIYRSVRPQGSLADFTVFMGRHPLSDVLLPSRLSELYQFYAPDRFNLSDRGYVGGVNPLELWLVSYLQNHPNAIRKDILQASQTVRLESYAWLFRPSLKRAQDTRIRIMLEADAFAHLHKRWARLGYPFDRLVPSLATAIGSSADRPGALAELVGIILNDGVRMPTERFESLLFGENTPYQTLLEHKGKVRKETLLDPAIAHIMKKIMSEVVENGTAKRVKGVYKDLNGNPLAVGGKTGTGDQRYDTYSPGGKMISSRVMNRTGTFAFYIGDHFFGTITAHVAGDDAADYKFTSALSAQVLKSLEPIFGPLINGGRRPDEVLPAALLAPTTTPATVITPLPVAQPEPIEPVGEEAQPVETEAPSNELINNDVPNNDQPKIEEPKSDLPTVFEPKIDAPKIDMPKNVTPSVEQPKLEAPKEAPSKAKEAQPASAAKKPATPKAPTKKVDPDVYVPPKGSRWSSPEPMKAEPEPAEPKEVEPLAPRDAAPSEPATVIGNGRIISN